MYEAHFGFSGPPFQLNPDPSFYFNSRGHGHALAYLRYGAAQGEGFIVVTGEIGAGKTTLVRTLLDELDRAKIVPAQIVSTQLGEDELLQAILSAYGIPSQGNSKASLLATLEAFLMALATQGRRALLIVDEAQNLQTKVIEELRMLSNFQLGTHALLQSFLVGQPELRKKLESPELEQLRQRVTASCHLGPLDQAETQAYVAHRLRRVGWDGTRPQFSDAAFQEVHRWSGGVPRRINRLCNRLLLGAFLENQDAIDASQVERTALELRQEIGEVFEPLPPARVETPPPAATAAAPAVQPVADTSPTTSERAEASASSARPDEAAAPAVDLELELPTASAGSSADPVHAAPTEAVAPAEEPAPPAVEAPIALTASPEPADEVDALASVVGEPEADTAVPEEAPIEAVAEPMEPVVEPSEAVSEPVPEAALVEPTPSTDVDQTDDEVEAARPEASASEPESELEAELVPADLPAETVDEQAYQAALVSIHEDVSGPRDVVRTQNLVLKRGYGVLLCLADTAGSALKAAAIAKALAAVDGAPRMLLVNPGLQTDVWPWGEMESILPAMEVGLHLGVTAGAFEHVAPVLFERLAEVIEEFSPLGMLSIGSSDSVLACTLLAHKRGIPVVRIEAGDRQSSEVAGMNALLIEQVADMLFAVDVPQTHRVLHQLGLMPERVHSVPGRLASDVLAAVEPAMTTPYGAFLRHNLPMFLGPRWSTQVDGTPYAAVALDVRSGERLPALLDVLLAVDAVEKIVWLTNAATRQVIEQALADQSDLVDRLCVVGEGRLARAEVDRRNSARILCCEVNNLPDQFSILRGAVCLISEPGQLLADVAEGFDLPTLLVQGRRLSFVEPGKMASDHVFGAIVLNEKLHPLVARDQALVEALKEDAEVDPMRPILPKTADGRISAAQGIATRLQGWVTVRQVAHRAHAGGAPQALASGSPDA